MSRATRTVGDDGKAADEKVSSLTFVQRAADPDEILDLRRASVRAIVSLIQRSASSKLENR